ncbi:MAG: hypothetical protein AB7U20_10425 [Planctomycetaceae bacterium]
MNLVPGLEKINKRDLIHTAARNLNLLLRDLFGIGKRRVLQAGLEALEGCAASPSVSWFLQIAARRFVPRTELHPEWYRTLAARRLKSNFEQRSSTGW